jgi:hypothetical protein
MNYTTLGIELSFTDYGMEHDTGWVVLWGTGDATLADILRQAREDLDTGCDGRWIESGIDKPQIPEESEVFEALRGAVRDAIDNRISNYGEIEITLDDWYVSASFEIITAWIPEASV